jgi:hypothetical protein
MDRRLLLTLRAALRHRAPGMSRRAGIGASTPAAAPASIAGLPAL